MKSLRIVMAALLASAGAQAAELEQVLEQRLAGDRSGVCVAAARIGEHTELGFFCANADNPRSLDADSRFEIGSLSKALQGLLVARLAERGEIALDQPLATLLPEGTSVPQFADEPIRLIHVLTHTAGLPRLPPDFEITDPDNPYADYTPENLLADLEATELQGPPGASFGYSNYGAMLLSYALVHHSGQSLATLLEQEIFEPLGMNQTGLDGTTVAGHAGRGRAADNWDFHPDLGGVGAIRSTPADMARWLEASLGRHDGPLAGALAKSREVLIEADGQLVGYGWLHLPLGENHVLAHDGGTGGFSSFAALDPETGRASLVLMDTSMVLRGSLGDLAMHLVDDSVPMEEPEPASARQPDLDFEALTGRFALYDGEEPFMGDFVLEFSNANGELLVQASVGGQIQPKVGLDPDGEDRFVNPDIDLTIEFQRNESDEVHGLDFNQGPLDLHGKRL